MRIVVLGKRGWHADELCRAIRERGHDGSVLPYESLVASFGDDVPVGGDLPLQFDEAVADRYVVGRQVDSSGDFRRADGGRDVLAVEQRVDAVEIDRQLVGQAGDCLRIVETQAAPQRSQRNGTVHRARIEEREAESLGQPATNRAFSRTCGAIDRDNHPEAHSCQ